MSNFLQNNTKYLSRYFYYSTIKIIMNKTKEIYSCRFKQYLFKQYVQKLSSREVYKGYCSKYGIFFFNSIEFIFKIVQYILNKLNYSLKLLCFYLIICITIRFIEILRLTMIFFIRTNLCILIYLQVDQFEKPFEISSISSFFNLVKQKKKIFKDPNYLSI